MKPSFLALISMMSLLSACGGGDNADLRQFIQQEKNKPPGRIEPIPSYPPYESYIYSAASIRSPFDKPVDIQRRVFAKADSNVKPDLSRTKEYLEGFDIAGMAMVGTLKKGGTLWALVKDPSGGIHPVKGGNYIGKNHGKIMSIDNAKIELIEIVSDGLDGWLERPRVLALAEKD